MTACAQNGTAARDEVVISPDAPLRQVNAEQDSTFSYVSTLDREAFQEAFRQLDEKNFTRYSRTEQFDQDDFLLAFDEQVVRHSGPRSRRTFERMAHDSAGTFDYGYLSRFVPGAVEIREPMDFSRRIVPTDPAYLSARNRDSFEYTPLPDTLMGDVTARVVEIRARPEVGDGQNLRRTRLFVDRASDNLIAIYIERVDLAMWYREESLFYLHIRQAPDGSWLPYTTRFETRVVIPFRPVQRFRTVSAYFEYGQ